jgi:hypothetical protein
MHNLGNNFKDVTQGMFLIMNTKGNFVSEIFLEC